MRPQDWPERLAAFIEERRFRPLSEGDNDHLSFAVAAAVAVTGRAFDALDAPTDRGAVAFGTALFGEPNDNILRLSRGDIALVLDEATQEPALMVCLGNDLAGPGLTGVIGRPMADALKFWPVL